MPAVSSRGDIPAGFWQTPPILNSYDNNPSILSPPPPPPSTLGKLYNWHPSFLLLRELRARGKLKDALPHTQNTLASMISTTTSSPAHSLEKNQNQPASPYRAYSKWIQSSFLIPHLTKLKLKQASGYCQWCSEAGPAPAASEPNPDHLLYSVHEISLAHSGDHLFPCCLWLTWLQRPSWELSSHDRDCMAHSIYYLQ